MCERRRELVVAEDTRGGEDVIGARGGDGAGGAVALRLGGSQEPPIIPPLIVRTPIKRKRAELLPENRTVT